MEITLNELLTKGKPLVIKNREYFETARYVEPFLERMSKYTDNFICNVKCPDTMTKTEDVLDQGFTRVWVQAVLPDEFGFYNHQQVVGFLYGIDVRKPVVKMYSGGLNMACLNLCLFNPSQLVCQELEPETPINYKPINDIINKEDEINKALTKLTNTVFTSSENNVNTSLGKWLRNSMHYSNEQGFGKVKLAASTILDAYKLLFEDEESPYFVPMNTETSMFNIYNSFTEIICNKDKDIMNTADKTLLLNKILTL